MSERFPDEVLRQGLVAAGLHGVQGGAFEAAALAALRGVLDAHLTRACTENPLQNELLDLITLMPDTQTQELVDYVLSLRATRGRRDAPQDQDRAAFEAWIRLPPIEARLDRHIDEASWPGQYVDYPVQLAWEAWQAARGAADPGPKNGPYPETGKVW